MKPLFDYLKKLSNPHLMCLPNNMCDLIAYSCNIRVHWGSHGYPFSKVAHIIPVITKTISTIHQEFGVTHLLLDLNYASPEQLRLNKQPVWSSSTLALFELGD